MIPSALKLGRAFGFIGFGLLLLVPLAFLDFLPGAAVHNLVVPKLALLRLAAAAFFVSLALRASFEPSFLRRLLKAAWPLLPLFAWQCASFVWTEYAWATTEAVADGACVTICALGAVPFFSRGHERRFAEKAFAISVVAAAIIFLYHRGLKMHYPFVNENPAGMFFAVAAAAALGRLANSIAGARHGVPLAALAFCVPLIALSVAGVFASGSTGAALSLAGGALALVIAAWRGRLVVMAAMLAPMTAFLAVVIAFPSFKAALLGPKYESTAWARVFFWRGALAMIEEKPLLGRGAGAFAPANVRCQPVESYMHKGIKSATPYSHCFYLDIAAETGVGGVAIFLGAVAFVFLKGRGAMRRMPADRWLIAGLLGAMTAALLHGGVDIVMSLPTTQIFFWLCAAAILGRAMQEGGKTAARGVWPRWAAAALCSACAVAAWAVFFGGELRREQQYSLARDEYRRGDLLSAERHFTAALDAPCPAQRLLDARLERAQVLNALALELGEPAEENRARKAAYYTAAIDEMRRVRALAPGWGNSDMNLGFVLINRGALEGNEADVAEGCALLVEHLGRNPFNIPEKDESAHENDRIFAALRRHLKDPALKRELIEILANALELVADGEVPLRVLAAAEGIRAYMEELALSPDVRDKY